MLCSIYTVIVGKCCCGQHDDFSNNRLSFDIISLSVDLFLGVRLDRHGFLLERRPRKRRNIPSAESSCGQKYKSGVFYNTTLTLPPPPLVPNIKHAFSEKDAEASTSTLFYDTGSLDHNAIGRRVRILLRQQTV